MRRVTFDLVTSDPRHEEAVVYLVDDGPWPLDDAGWTTTVFLPAATFERSSKPLADTWSGKTHRAKRSVPTRPGRSGSSRSPASM